ncbi:hypothetical protein, partial [Burkholderia gladioli]|uniref:hypothetical protein n=1 Tax=Burkholderia gladioli TaxID=28095 RepID=UPI001ABB491A
ASIAMRELRICWTGDAKSRGNRSQYYWHWPQPRRQQLMAQFQWRRSSQSETTRFEWVHNIIKSLPEEARRQHHEHEADFR